MSAEAGKPTEAEKPEFFELSCCNARMCLPPCLAFRKLPCLHCSCMLPSCGGGGECCCPLPKCKLPKCPCPKCPTCPMPSCPTGGCRCVFPHPSCGVRVTMPKCSCCCCFPCLKMPEEERLWWVSLGKDDSELWSLCCCPNVACCALIPGATKQGKKASEGPSEGSEGPSKGSCCNCFSGSNNPMSELKQLRKELNELKAVVQQRM